MHFNCPHPISTSTALQVMPNDKQYLANTKQTPSFVLFQFWLACFLHLALCVSVIVSFHFDNFVLLVYCLLVLISIICNFVSLYKEREYKIEFSTKLSTKIEF